MTKYRVQVDLKNQQNAENIAEFLQTFWDGCEEVLVIPLEDEDED